MEGMTWKEFKEEMEKQMAEQGISQNQKIWYVDFSYPEKNGYQKPEVRDGEYGIIIS